MPKEVEYVAAALAVLYLLLAIKQWRSCWVAAFVSSCLYVLVLFEARLYMESALNVFYAGMAIYGYWCWRSGAASACDHGGGGRKSGAIRVAVVIGRGLDPRLSVQSPVPVAAIELWARLPHAAGGERGLADANPEIRMSQRS